MYSNKKGNFTPTTGVKNNYTYNGKERIDNFGLRWSNYGFRFYDPSIARFTTVDPLTEQFAHQSGYVYADNDPVGKTLWG